MVTCHIRHKQVQNSETASFSSFASGLGFLGVGRYVVLIRSVYSVPPDRYGLVEAWKAIGIVVDG